MTAPSAAIVQKLWNYCNILRDDGLSYGDYTEQLTFLLFLKMAHERTQAPWKDEPIVPAKHGWPMLVAKDGDALEVQYRHTLEELGELPGMLGLIFRKAQNKIQDTAKLKRLVSDLIDREPYASPFTSASSVVIFWLRDESLADSANLPDPDVIAEEIVEDLRAALVQFEELWAGLGAGRPEVPKGLP